MVATSSSLFVLLTVPAFYAETAKKIFTVKKEFTGPICLFFGGKKWQKTLKQRCSIG